MDKSLLLPVLHSVVKKVRDEVAANEKLTILELEYKIEEALLSDRKVGKEIDRLTDKLNLTPKWILYLRASIRPFITVILTLTFIALIFAGLLMGSDPDKLSLVKDIMTVFLGIYGSVIGFWFGEHTATKRQAELLQEAGITPRTH